MRKTKIICTLGPATDDPAVLEALIHAGMNVARLNFSHGTQDEQAVRIQAVKEARTRLNLPVGIMLDTRGPEIRIKTFKDGRITLNRDDVFTLTTRDVDGDKSIVSVTYDRLPQNLSVGTKILIDDGLVGMVVENLTDTDAVCRVQNGGDLSNRKSINIPGVKVDMDYLNEKDKSDIAFGIKQGIDFIAASFVRSRQDLLLLQDFLKENDGLHVDVISKIENREGVINAADILDFCQGIMVARGDLGVEVPFDELPKIQKDLISLCTAKGKSVITATQMLDSMIKNPRPTRAETSDVANAVYDGTTAIMLSGETSIGKYPVETVKTMVSIAEKSEANIDYVNTLNYNVQSENSTTSAISHATVNAAHDMGADKIIAISTSGYTTRSVSARRPKIDIIGATPTTRTYYKMALYWGVTPLLVDNKSTTEELFAEVIKCSRAAGLLKTADKVAITAGLPIGVAGTTNTLRIAVVE